MPYLYKYLSFLFSYNNTISISLIFILLPFLCFFTPELTPKVAAFYDNLDAPIMLSVIWCYFWLKSFRDMALIMFTSFASGSILTFLQFKTAGDLSLGWVVFAPFLLMGRAYLKKNGKMPLK